MLFDPFHFKCYIQRLHILMKSEPPTKLGPLAKILSSYVCPRGDFKQRNFRVEHVDWAGKTFKKDNANGTKFRVLTFLAYFDIFCSALLYVPS